ncbi:MAG: protein-methionine-sulfoxide reductase catalytic subunit MsrP [Ignavibacteriales bacterium]|nr:protein-methionine-sulfoxide reductase catalytic subunit MsrP [Ignavibacteriales bacterium]
MLIKRGPEIPSSEVTPESVYHGRRTFLKKAAFATAGLATAGVAGPLTSSARPQNPGWNRPPAGPYNTDEDLTSFKDITTYNNFYEFGTDKDDPYKNAGDFKTRPWRLTIEGEVRKPAAYELDDFLKPYKLEDRVYRLRCVEGWSMIIPWLGFPIGDVVRKVEPTSRARYIEFTTLHDPRQMPGQKRPVLNWPYVEGLRMDEAMHPLAIFVVGLYGKELPNQNGAPFRIVVPWKYGFKSCKSIVKIRFVENEPRTTWNIAAPNEYGFYSNVNPDVDHPRWSQKFERRIGEFRKRRTMMFNGYGDQVASLYTGMDLRKHF